MWYIHVIKYSSAIKRNKVPVHGKTWMNLKTCWEKAALYKEVHMTVPLYKVLEEAKSRTMGTWDGEGGFTGKEQRESLGVMVIFSISFGLSCIGLSFLWNSRKSTLTISSLYLNVTSNDKRTNNKCWTHWQQTC